jgi:hypothetical protein
LIPEPSIDDAELKDTNMEEFVNNSFFRNISRVSSQARDTILKHQHELTEENKVALLAMGVISTIVTNGLGPSLTLSFDLVKQNYYDCTDFQHQVGFPLSVYRDSSNILFPNTVIVAARDSNQTIGKLKMGVAAIISFLLKNNRVQIDSAALSGCSSRVNIRMNFENSSDVNVFLSIFPRSYYYTKELNIPVDPYLQEESEEEGDEGEVDGRGDGTNNSSHSLKRTDFPKEMNYSSCKPFTRSMAPDDSNRIFVEIVDKDCFADIVQRLHDANNDLKRHLDSSDENIYLDTRKRFSILHDINLRCCQEELTGSCNKPLSEETKQFCAEGCARIGSNHYDNWFRKILPLASLATCKAISRKYRAGADASIAAKAIAAQVSSAHALMRKEALQTKLYGIKKGEKVKPLDRHLYTVMVMDGTGITEKIEANHTGDYGKTTGTVTLTGPSKAYQVTHSQSNKNKM